MIKGTAWGEYIKPAKIFGNLYFIGIRAVCTHLIDTGEGLIIIDPGYSESLHIIVNNIWELGFKPTDIKYIVVTHAHYDHMGGAEDVRVVARELNQVVQVYGTQKDMLALRRQMPYVFEPTRQSTMKLHYIKPYKSFKIKHLEIMPILQYHGQCNSIGYRIGDFAYCTDVKSIDKEGWRLLKGIKTWVLGCVTTTENEKHIHLEEALKWIKKINPNTAYLTHMGSKMDYNQLKKTLPKGVYPCYDGMVIKL